MIMPGTQTSRLKMPFLFGLFLLLFSFFFSFLNFSIQARTYDPGLNWQVMESQHFLVIFPGKSPTKEVFDYQQIAGHVAKLAEETIQQITPQFGELFNPNKKIAIILEDFSDSTYGFATVLPHRLIRINLSAPNFKIFNTQFESWLKILLAHEYTHIAHFDMTNKTTTFLRFFLGQVIAPNALQPVWAIEGLAIYNESKWTTGGRLEDSRYEMYLRTDFQENQVKTLDQIHSYYLISWPGANAPYIYGQSLVHFIVQHFGEEKLIAISDEFSAFPYLGMDRALKKVIGMNQNELFEKWHEEQRLKYENEIEQVLEFSEITQSQQITNHHYWVDMPLWIPSMDGHSSRLLYQVRTPYLYPTIREYDTDTQQESILVKRTTGHSSPVSLSPDNQYLVFSRLLSYEKFYRYYDLFVYHLTSGKQVRLSEGMRIKDPAWRTSNQNQILAVINQAGSNQLVLFSINPSVFDTLLSLEESGQEKNLSSQQLLSFSELTYLSDFKPETQISQPVWSPQGNKIAFSLWQDGFQDIYIMTLDDVDNVISIYPVTSDKHTNVSPYWSPDGQYIYFSSDRTGIFNLYAYSLREKDFFQLTNVTTGAFEPAISPTGNEVAFIQYHASGYELHLTDIDQLLWYPINDTGDGSLFQQNKQNREPSPVSEVRDYSPWDSIWPTYWIPYLSMTSNDLYLGFSSLAQDYLKFYTIPFTFAQGLLNQSLYYQINFFDYTREPFFSLSLQGETSSYGQVQANINFTDEGYTSQLDSGRYYSQNISLGFQKEWMMMDHKQQNNLKSDKRNVNSLILTYRYSDTERYPASISPEVGQAFSLSYQHANQKIGSDITFNKFLFDGRKYFPIFHDNHVLALRLVAGISTGELDEKQFYLGGNQSDVQLKYVNSKSFPLRGFPSSSFQGNNLFLTSLEYRFPIKTVEQNLGFDWASIFLERISGTLFMDLGHAWDGHLENCFEEMNISLGAEINLRFNLAYSNAFTFTIGAGKALTEASPFRVHAQIGISF